MKMQVGYIVGVITKADYLALPPQGKLVQTLTSQHGVREHEVPYKMYLMVRWILGQMCMFGGIFL